MKRPIQKTVKFLCLFITAIGLTVAAYNDVLSMNSMGLPDSDGERIFTTFIEKTSASDNCSIVLTPTQGDARPQGTIKVSRQQQNVVTHLEGEAPFSVIFETCDLPQEVISYDWSFGDGNVSSGGRVAHTFQNQGTYMITLKILEKTGAMKLDKVKIKVLAPPQQF